MKAWDRVVTVGLEGNGKVGHSEKEKKVIGFGDKVKHEGHKMA